MEKFVIYKITNTVNGKIYIGQTSNFVDRKKNHRYHGKSGKYDFPLYKAMRKYDVENFKFEIIDNSDTREDLNEREKYWIEFYNSKNREIGYNVLDGGEERVFDEEYLLKTHKAMYLSGPRGCKYKGVNRGESSFYSQFKFKENRCVDGPFRTEIEAAWSADLITKENIGEDYDFYKNFPNGKTKELIIEQLITKKIGEIELAVNNPHIAKRDKYHVYVTNIKTKKKTPLKYGTLDECNVEIDKFIRENKCIKMFRGTLSLINLQNAYEELHGSILASVTEDELNEALENELGKFE